MKNEIILILCILFLGFNLLHKNDQLERALSVAEFTKKLVMEEAFKNLKTKGVYQSVLLEAAEYLEACTHESRFEFDDGILKRLGESWAFIPYEEGVESWILVPHTKTEEDKNETHQVKI